MTSSRRTQWVCFRFAYKLQLGLFSLCGICWARFHFSPSTTSNDVHNCTIGRLFWQIQRANCPITDFHDFPTTSRDVSSPTLFHDLVLLLLSESCSGSAHPVERKRFFVLEGSSGPGCVIPVSMVTGIYITVGLTQAYVAQQLTAWIPL